MWRSKYANPNALINKKYRYFYEFLAVEMTVQFRY